VILWGVSFQAEADVEVTVGVAEAAGAAVAVLAEEGDDPAAEEHQDHGNVAQQAASDHRPRTNQGSDCIRGEAYVRRDLCLRRPFILGQRRESCGQGVHAARYDTHQRAEWSAVLCCTCTSKVR